VDALPEAADAFTADVNSEDQGQVGITLDELVVLEIAAQT